MTSKKYTDLNPQFERFISPSRVEVEFEHQESEGYFDGLEGPLTNKIGIAVLNSINGNGLAGFFRPEEVESLIKEMEYLFEGTNPKSGLACLMGDNEEAWQFFGDRVVDFGVPMDKVKIMPSLLGTIDLDCSSKTLVIEELPDLGIFAIPFERDKVKPS